MAEPRSKATRRRLVMSDDDNDDDITTPNPGPSRKAKLVQPGPSKRGKGRLAYEDEINIDGDEVSVLLQAKSRSAKRVSQKKRKRDFSDDEFGSEEDNIEEDSFIDEDDFLMEEPRQSAKPKVRKNQGKEGLDVQDIIVKDERKSAGKRRPPTIKLSDIPVDTSPSTSAVSSVLDSAIPSSQDATKPPPAKKPKLPPIKKNKSATPIILGSTPTPRDIIPVKKPSVLNTNPDIDLRDSNIYAQLFQQPSGPTPRSGLNRRVQDEEKRKELDRLRAEARTKREQDNKTAFNLQKQMDDVMNWEEKFRQMRSAVVFPNLLAAKWKDIYEHEKRARREEGQLS